MDRYIYLIWSLIFGAIWLFLYLQRRDVRHQMLLISFLFGIGGIISQNTHIKDWWQPLTVTYSRLGIEDFLIGFFIGGISSVVYEELYKRKVKIKKNHFKTQNMWILVFFPVLFLILFYVFRFTSFYSAVFSYLVGILSMLFLRYDLLDDSVLSGLFMLFLGSSVYLTLNFFQANFVKEFWYLPDVWYAKLFLGIPLGEYVWFFLTGAFIGPLYVFIEKGQLVKQK